MIISNQQVQRVIKLQQAPRSIRKAESVTTQNTNDKLELSGSAQELQYATDLALKSPDIRADKVNNLKKEIASGNYQVSGADVAAEMVNRSLADELARR